MKTAAVTLSTLLTCTALSAEFLTDFQKLQKANDQAGVETLLDASKTSEADNPDYYAAAASYWWKRSQNPITISSKPADAGDFSLTDRGTGEEVGSISTSSKTDPKLQQKAFTYLREGSRRFPERADIALGLANAKRSTGDSKGAVEPLLRLLHASGANELKWTENKPLPSPAATFIPESMQGYNSWLFNQETEEADVLCETLCNAIIKAYPDHPYAYNIKAALYDAQDKPKESLAMLEVASAKAPGDVYILLNLGDVQAKSGAIPEARVTFGKVLKLKDIEQAFKLEAEKALKALPEE